MQTMMVQTKIDFKRAYWRNPRFVIFFTLNADCVLSLVYESNETGCDECSIQSTIHGQYGDL